jgi:SAM-dependent methyltransferase
MGKDSDSSEILNYYNAGVEGERLQRGIGKIELARTRELLLRYLPPAPAVIYDIGGGRGAYSFWLARMGYEVHLFDLSPGNVEGARSFSESQEGLRLAGVEVADGRDIHRPDGSADMVLVMGPLYHLTGREERLDALREAKRLLLPGGRMAAAAITRFGSTLYGLTTYSVSNWLLDEEAFQQMIGRELADGQHIRPEQYPGFIARAFFHLPEELRQEAVDAGFEQVELFAVEGPGWIVPGFDAVWGCEAQREAIVRVVRAVEQEPSLMGMSPHFLAFGRKLM